jgi:K+-transporting ATPase KdpF subunit
MAAKITSVVEGTERDVSYVGSSLCYGECAVLSPVALVRVGMRSAWFVKELIMIENILLLVVVAFLFLYLVYALLRPEKF